MSESNEQLSLDEAIDIINAAIEQGSKNANALAHRFAQGSREIEENPDAFLRELQEWLQSQQGGAA
jgi:hypothetical protein